MHKSISLPTRMKFIATPTSQWFVAGLIVGFLIVLGVAVRQPTSNVTPIEGYWTPNVQFGTWYVANKHHLFPVSGDIPTISNYTSGLNYGSVDFVHTFLTGAALTLSNITDISAISTVYLWLPWQGLLLVPLAALAIYNRWARSVGQSIHVSHIVALFGFATFSTYQMIGWSSSGGFATPLGWGLFLSLYIALFARTVDRRYSWQWSIIAIITLLLLQATYHTIALIIAIILPTLWIIQRLFNRNYISFTTIQLNIVIFFSFLAYYAVTFWNAYGHLATQFLKDIYRSHDDQLLQYNLQTFSINPLWYIINYLAILLPVIWIVLLALRQRKRTNIDALALNYQLAWFIVLVPLAILLFAWNGVIGAYARLLQYGCLLAIPAMAYLLVTRRNAFLPLSTAALACILISVILLRIYPILSTNYITHDEIEAIQWISTHQGCNDVIFTDFRIGPTFGYQGCFAVVGPTASNLRARGHLDVLTALLYQADSTMLSRAIDAIETTDGRQPDTLLISRRFLDPQTGFFMPDIRAQPMTEAQWRAYRSMSRWRIIFENTSTMVMARSEKQH